MDREDPPGTKPHYGSFSLRLRSRIHFAHSERDSARYEASAIAEWLKRSPGDPLTQAPLRAADLWPNAPLADAVRNVLLRLLNDEASPSLRSEVQLTGPVRVKDREIYPHFDERAQRARRNAQKRAFRGASASERREMRVRKRTFPGKSRSFTGLRSHHCAAHQASFSRVV